MRFRAPLPPQNYTGVDNGSIGRVCPQAPTPWIAITYDFLNSYVAGQPFNFSAAEAAANTFYVNATTSVDPRVTEDCLFLDVYAPKKVLQEAGIGQTGAPVLVWITGGGYIQGDKINNGQWNPKDLIKTSQSAGTDGLIFLSINYRISPVHSIASPDAQISFSSVPSASWGVLRSKRMGRRMLAFMTNGWRSNGFKTKSTCSVETRQESPSSASRPGEVPSSTI